MPNFESFNLEEFKLGWIVGNFVPTLIQSNDIEVAIKYFKSGDTEPSHMQLVATEITIVVSVKIPPKTLADFESLTDSALVCIKYPSFPNDKVLE